MIKIKRNKTPKKTRRIIIPLVVTLVLVAAGLGYYLWNQRAQASTRNTTTISYKTTVVRRGNLTISASGAGTLVASQTANLSFSTSGTVGAVNVQVGDQVTQGQVLAQLSDITTLQANVNSANLDLLSAQQALATFRQNAASNLANAQLAVVNDQKALTDAKSALIQPGMTRCDQTTTDAYYSTYMRLKDQLDALGDGGGNTNYYLTVIVPAKNNVNRAYTAYLYCAGFTDYEIQSSQAKLALAESQLKSDQATLDTLQKNNGLDPIGLAQAENTLANAQAALDKANQTLAGATLKAPFDGTILSVAGQAGDQATTTTFITIADLKHPQVQFYIDETDLDKLAMGETIQVVFDAMPDKTFNGKVIRIYPTLETVNNYQAVKALAQLDLGNEKTAFFIPQGASATITAIAGQAQNALLIPIAALRDLGNGQYGVFVVNPNGQLRFTLVTPGLMDSTTAEIKQGLSLGNTVSTGITEAQ